LIIDEVTYLIYQAVNYVPNLMMKQGFMKELGVPITKLKPLYFEFLCIVGFLIFAELYVMLC
jgi:hypothetical protein